MDRRDRNIGTPAPKSLKGKSLKALVLMAPIALAGCGTSNPEKAAAEAALRCPKVSIVRDLASVTQFRPGRRDQTDIVSRAVLADYAGNCDYRKNGVTVNLNLTLVAERGPAMQGNQANYRYFVAVTRPGEEVPVSKTEFDTTVDFPAGQNRAGNREELAPVIPLPEDANAKDWQVIVGFQLSEDQLRYNLANVTKR